MSRTYDEILSTMKEKYTELSGITPSENSDITLRMKVLAGEIYNSLVNVEWLKTQMLPDSATGEYLDYHASERGLARREAAFSQGEVIFSRMLMTVKDTLIPAKTIVATVGDDPVYFETTQDATILAETYSTIVPVRAITAGTSGNVPEKAISVIVTPITGVQEVTNPDACESGADAESDESLRVRILESIKAPSNGTNCSYYKKICEEIPTVTSAGVVPRGRGAGTVDVYVAAQGAEVSDEVLETVQAKLSELREVNVDVKAYKAQLTPVSIYLRIDVLEGYEFEDVENRCIKALSEYISTRGVGGNVLLSEAGDRIQHTRGIKEYTLFSYANSDVRCDESHCPCVGTISVKEGVLE